MTKRNLRWFKMTKLAAGVAAASLSFSTQAFQFYYGDLEASLDTTLTVGASIRTQDRDRRILGAANQSDTVSASSVGNSLNSDDGNWNFDKGSTYSKIIKGSTDFITYYEDYGLFARARYWYDFELKDDPRAADDNGYVRELSSEGKANASGAEFLDAYIWGDFYVQDMPLNLRFGYQVVSWGESTFIFNGINVVNPIDLGAIRAPGAEVKDALLPIPMVYGSLGITEDTTLEAFVQLRSEETRIDDCGTFFSTNDFVADGCTSVYVDTAGGPGATGGENFGNGAAVRRAEDRLAKDTDQFGLALRMFLPELNESELGLYYIQYHSRFPVTSGITGNVPGDFTNARYFVEYPEDIKLFGISLNTTAFNGWSIGGEYSYKMDAPVQLNSNDLLTGALLIDQSPLFQERVSDANDDGDINFADAVLEGFPGSEQRGYDLYDISQIQVTGINFWDQVFGASRLAFVGEVGATYVHHLSDVTRYGRYDQAGQGDTGYSNFDCGGRNVNVDGCRTDGYVTDFSWGYRMRAALTYSDVYQGVSMTPQINWTHDVKGVAPGPGANFIEGRKSIGLSVRFDYLNQYSATMAYTNYFGGEPFNALIDRDNLAFSLAYSF